MSGCYANKEYADPPIVIDGIPFSAEEFENEYKRSSYANIDTPEVKKEFLDLFIAKKLVIRAAEKQGLDKDPDFLKDVEAFWQQSLFKLYVERQAQRFIDKAEVSEAEMKDYYEQYKDEYFKDKVYEQTRSEIRVIIQRLKQQQMMTEWVNSLRDRMGVAVDQVSLGIDQ
jgi:uncharacterized NAD(P)/FAD-binding protein YdhS